MNEKEIRAAAIQASASCAPVIGLSDPYGVLQVADMMAAYIQNGRTAAESVISSWSATPPNSSGSNHQPEEAPQKEVKSQKLKAQDLANSARKAKNLGELNAVQEFAKMDKLESQVVHVQGADGALGDYLEYRRKEMTSVKAENVRSDLGL